MSAHVIAVPVWILAIRVVQAVLALLILILTAYSTAFIGETNMIDALGVNLFTAPAALICIAYLSFSPTLLHAAYNIWAALALEIFMVIMWLVSFAILASYTSSFYIFTDSYCYYCYKFTKRAVPGYTPWTTAAAASGLGGLEFIFFIITLVVFGLALHKHRTSTLRNTETPGTTEAKIETAAPVAGGAVPQQGVPQQQYPQQGVPQQQYPQQGVPQQQYPQQGVPQQYPQQGVPQAYEAPKEPQVQQSTYPQYQTPSTQSSPPPQSYVPSSTGSPPPQGYSTSPEVHHPQPQ